MSFINDDLLLETPVARTLYHQFAAKQPVIDYHCHLSPKDITENRQFENLFEIWLEGDHYKWRAMRANGEAERFCTGDADPYDKFLAFARTVPHTLRNPLYHWTHLELERYFGLSDLLSEATAPRIWEAANAQLTSGSLRARDILKQWKVELVGTTDDPTDSLEYHAQIDEPGLKVVPTFRPDKAFAIGSGTPWQTWVDQLAETSGEACDTLDSLKAALAARMDHFSAHGCLASDHGLAACPTEIASDVEAAKLFERARSGLSISAREVDAFAGHLLIFLGEAYARLGWAMQLHLGPIRNNNRGLFDQLGPDIGCDSIGDRLQIDGLATILGELSVRNALPKTILYNLNPRDNYAFATMAANFSEEGVPGKMQFGSGWWFLDQLEGMTWQLNTISNLGLLSHFIGMLTDSRSFMSFPRHEYFRRLLCNLLGEDVRRGHVPDDLDTLGALVERVSYKNAAQYFSS
ncbi:MAG: glucuronate isomerase [Opitutales bacterium]|nr:glucuronate isomerase [Opitutales bacterium]